jgi:hypothetical protein
MAALAALALAATLVGCGSTSNPTAPSQSLDTTPPPVPTSLAMGYDGPAGAYELTWAASSAADLAGYEVYLYSPDPSRDNAYVRIGSPAEPRLHIPVPLSDTDAVLRVRARDESGNLSAYSAPYVGEMTTLGPGSDGEGLKRR